MNSRWSSTGRFIEMVVDLASQRKHCAPYHYRTGIASQPHSTLRRTGKRLTAGPGRTGLRGLARLDWNDPEFAEVQVLFLRAARAIDDRRLDLPKSLRNKIADRLEKCGIAPVKAGRLRKAMPIERTERVSLFGEALPPGLILSG